MARLNGYLAGAAFALTAVAAAAAYAQAGAPAAADRAQQEADRDAARPAGDHMVRHEERRIIIRDGEHGDHETMMFHGRHADMAEHLRTMLQLKPGQEGALQAYVAAVKPQMPMHEHDVMFEAGKDGPPKTTPERLAEMEKHMAESQAAAHARIEATRKFYAQLEPSQKKVFDEMPMLMLGPVGPMGPMMMHGPMKIRFEHPPRPPMPPMPPLPPEPPPPPGF